METARSQRVALEKSKAGEIPYLVDASDDDSVSSSESDGGASQRMGSHTKIRRWTRTDPNAKCFYTIVKGGPDWKHVKRRVTICLNTGGTVEDLRMDDTTSDKVLHRPLPKGISATATVLYHDDPDVEDADPDLCIDEDVGGDGDLRMEGLEISYPATANTRSPNDGPALVSQDDLGPSQNTRAARRQRLLTALDVSDTALTAKQMSARCFPQQFILDYAAAVLDEETGELLEYRHLIKNPKYKKDWGYSFGNEIGRLAQGMPGRNKGTNTIHFIHKSEVPPDR